MIHDIALIEGEQVSYTFTAKRGGTVVNLTNYTVLISMRDDGATTNRINAAACSLSTPLSGIFTYVFTTTDSNVASPDTDVVGTARFIFSIGSTIEKALVRYRIARDPFA